MRFRPAQLCVLALLFVVGLAACGGPTHIAQFWRPISEPNVEMPFDKLQRKLNFDLSQCHCGIYPTNVAHDEAWQFQKDKQQLVATGITDTDPDNQGSCLVQPSLVVTECMRQRGWEPTNCSGRMPLAGGGSLCTAFSPD